MSDAFKTYEIDDGEVLSRVWLSSASNETVLAAPRENHRLSLGVSAIANSLLADSTLSISSPSIQLIVWRNSFSVGGIKNKVYTLGGLGPIVREKLFLKETAGVTSAAYIVEAVCDCDYDEFCRKCETMPVYDYRNRSVTTAVFNQYIQLFPANRRRVSLSISASDPAGTGFAVNIASIGDDSRRWYSTIPPFTNVFSYRDWGPIIGDEIWVASNKVGLVFTGFETYKTGE